MLDLKRMRVPLLVLMFIVGLLAVMPLAAASLAPDVVTISGTVFFDKNGNGLRDATDTGIEGASLQLSDTATGGNAYSVASSSDSAGVYQFSGVPAGVYTLVQSAPEVYTTTTAASVEIVVADGDQTMDFGDTLLLYVTGAEFADLNHDGARGPGEPGFAGTLVRIFDDANVNGRVDHGEALLGSTTTDQHGFYVIGGLTPGHRVMVTETVEIGGVQGNDLPLSLEGSEIGAAALMLLNGMRDGGRAAAAAAPAVDGEILVGVRRGTAAAQVAALAAAHGAALKHRIGGDDYVLSVARGATGAVSAALQRAPGVLYAEPNYVVQGDAAPNDPAYQTCPPGPTSPNDPGYRDCPYTVWAPQWLNAEAAWAVTTGDPNLIVAVLDSGISYSHPEFAGRVLQGWDFQNLDNDAGGNYAQDDFGHGTHVSGIIGAAINNGQGMVGIAPNVKILPVKVLTATGSGDASKVASGIYYAVDNGAKIINLSLGSTASSTPMLNALRYAVEHDVLVTCAAGNNGSNINFYPGAYAECFAVAGTMEEDAWYTLSNWGAWVDISAPASSIYSTLWTATNANTYLWKDGTSQAAPHVAGLAALLLSVNPALKPGDLRAIISQSAVDLGAAGWDDHYGAGRIDIGAAVALAQGWIAYTPTPTHTATATATATNTSTATAAATNTPTATRTPTATATATSTPVYTPTATRTPTTTPTASRTPTPTQTATSTPTPTNTLTPTNTPAPYVQRVNVGNTSTTLFTDGQGQTWAADKAFATGSWGYVSGSAKSYTTAVGGTTDDALYQKLRESMTSYKFTVPPGPYNVTLRFADFASSATGKRTMKITVNGAIVETALDVYKTVGKAVALDKTYATTAGADGLITIAFTKVVGNPMVSAILVASAAPPPPTATPTPISTPTATATVCVSCPTNTPTPTRTYTPTPTATPTATNTPTATPTNTPPPFTVRVNAGSTTFTDGTGLVWLADKAYATGGWGYVGGTTGKSTTAVANTTDDLLYQKYRTKMTEYKFTVPNATYQVRLRFAEFSTTAVGARAMKITMEGAVVENALDVVVLAPGKAVAFDRTYPVTVTDGILNIGFARATGASLDPVISAIEVKN